MKIAIFYGTPRKGSTYYAASVFKDEMQKHDSVKFSEFFLPAALPEFCTGCALCHSAGNKECPHERYVTPILEAVIKADALVFTTPHYGACDMPASMKTLFDHLDFLTLNVSPRSELFAKKAFILTTGAGSAAALKIIKKALRHWGVNRVRSCGVRLFADNWKVMPEKRRQSREKSIRRSTRGFYRAKAGIPHPVSFLYYYASKFVLRKFVGEGNYPYEWWKEKGYFDKMPL